jgi:hypothetical protein
VGEKFSYVYKTSGKVMDFIVIQLGVSMMNSDNYEVQCEDHGTGIKEKQFHDFVFTAVPLEMPCI